MICSDKRIIGIISICRNKNKLTSNKFTTLWTIWQLWTISIERLIGTFKVSTVKTKHSCEYYYILAYKMTEAFLRLHLLFTVDTAWNPGKRSSDKMGRWAKHYTYYTVGPLQSTISNRVIWFFILNYSILVEISAMPTVPITRFFPFCTFRQKNHVI